MASRRVEDGVRGNRFYKALDGWLGRAGILLLDALRGRRQEPPSASAEVQRILVVKLSALGDTIILVPTLRALRRRYPRAEIAMVGTRVNEEIALRYAAYVDRFYRLDVARGARAPWTLLEFVRELREGQWQVAIDFDQWTHITPLLLKLAAVPVRIGFRTDRRIRHRLYSHVEDRVDGVHEAENFLRLLAPLGIRTGDIDLELTADEPAAARAHSHLRQRGWNGRDPLLLVHPGTGAPGTLRAERAWPVERYADLLRGLLAAGRSYFLVLSAAPDEVELAESLLRMQPAAGCVVTLPLADFIACLSMATLVISGNSGTMHLAAALRRPQIALHGPAGAVKWGPINPRAVVVESSCPDCPCLDMGWEYHRTDGFCMRQIDVEEVLRPALRMLRPDRRELVGVGADEHTQAGELEMRLHDG